MAIYYVKNGGNDASDGLSDGNAGLMGYGWGPNTHGDNFECGNI